MKRRWKISLFAVIAITVLSPKANAQTAQEQIFVDALNEYRESRGLLPVELCPVISEECRTWSASMSKRRILQHDPNRRIPAENCAVGHEDGISTLRQWQRSPAHNALLLSRNIDTIGVAQNEKWWTLRATRSKETYANKNTYSKSVNRIRIRNIFR